MLTIPTSQELRDAIKASLEAEMEATTTEEGKAGLNAFIDNQAARMKQLYLGIAEIQKNVFVDTCDEDMLLRVGQVKLGRLPFSPVAGNYTVQVTGTTGGVIPAGTTWKSDDDSRNPGVLYRLDDEHTMAAGTDSITLRCLTAGEDGKLDLGDTLTSTTPIPLVNKAATVTAETIQPLAGEDIEDYRQVVIDSYRLEAQGGSAADYRIWAADAQGVAKVYPYAKSGADSEVDLYIEATVADSSDGKGTPTAQILTDVEAVVNQNPDDTLDTDERGRRPVTVTVNYLAITPRAIVITVTGFQNLDTQTQTDLLTAFQDFIDNIRPFVASADIAEDRNDVLDTNKLIGVIIATRPGAVFTSVSFTVDAISQTSYQFTQGDIPWLNPTLVFN